MIRVDLLRTAPAATANIATMESLDTHLDGLNMRPQKTFYTYFPLITVTTLH